MHRLLVECGELEKDEPILSRDAQNHLKVLRPRDGEPIELFDGRGRSRVYVVRADAGTKTPRLLSSAQPSTSGRQPPLIAVSPRPPALTLFACVTKGSRWDWTIEKATELGVTRIVPVISGRTIVRIDPKEREVKRERWVRVAEDAARQSDAKWIPEIIPPVSFAESIPLVRETTCFVGALTNPPPRMIEEALSSVQPPTSNIQPPTFSIYVGPEGDFTPDELAALLKVATPVSFGSTILRAETAAIYGLSVVKAHLDCKL